jgi:purine-binding chemotaxis protein CheW
VGQGSIAIRASTRAAVVHCGPWKVAVISDGLEGLVVIPRRHLEAPPAESSGMAEFLSGVARDKLGTIAVLDLPRLVEAARSRVVPAGSPGA